MERRCVLYYQVQSLPYYLTKADHNWIYFFSFVLLICPGPRQKYPPVLLSIFPISCNFCCTKFFSMWTGIFIHNYSELLNYNLWHYKLSLTCLMISLTWILPFLILALWLLISSHWHLPGITLPILLFSAFPNHFVIGLSSACSTELGFVLGAYLKIFFSFLFTYF